MGVNSPATRRMTVPSIIALAQQKGGVGKSTLAIHMSVELSRRGKRVAIVDLDPQGTVMKWRTRREAPDPLVVTSEITTLKKRIEELGTCDFIVLDLPGRRGPDVTSGLRMSDMILVPSRPLDIDIEASGETIATCQRLGKRYAFVMTVVPPAGKRAHDFTDGMTARGYPVIPAIIMDRLDYPDAISEGLGVTEFRPNGKAAAEIAVFATAVMKEMQK
jgi:chromosome partitioning protein